MMFNRIFSLLGIGALIFVGACTEVELFKASASRSYDKIEKSVAGAKAETPQEVYQRALELRKKGDHAASVTLLKEAAGENHAAATYELGIAYNQGQGVRENTVKGARLMKQAARLGDSRAQYHVGAAYFHGTAGEKNLRKAAIYLGRASVQGHEKAQYLLARAFENGWGVPKDPAWAARWYGKAARRGHGPAQLAYGVVNSEGRGLPANRVTAYVWLTLAMKTLATENGTDEEALSLREKVAAEMSAAAIAKAKARAAAFAPAANTVFADSPTVMYVQYSLKSLGYDVGGVDGILGPRTRDGILSLQATRKMEKDGEISPLFLGRLLQIQRGG